MKTTMPKVIETCETCVYWASGNNYSSGHCRRYAPEPATGRDALAVWPTTMYTDWCGEYVKPVKP